MNWDLTESARSQIDSADSEDGPTLKFEDLGLLEVPEELIEILVSSSVRKLSFKGNALTTLPASVAELSSLTLLDISHNQFSELPECVCELVDLEILDLSSNFLQTLPQKMSSLSQLLAVSLKDNHIEYVPPVLADFPNLTVVELEANPLVMPPVENAAEASDPEWLTDFILENREALLEHTESSTHNQTQWEDAPDTTITRAAKRMGFVMRHEDAKDSNGSPPVPPESRELAPSPILPNYSPTSQNEPSKRILFALAQFVDVFERLNHVESAEKANIQIAELATMLENITSPSIIQAQCLKAIESVRLLLAPLLTSMDALMNKNDICLVRSLIMQTFLALNELHNAWTYLVGNQLRHINSADFAVADEQLYSQLESATTSSQSVLSLLNETIARSAQATAAATRNGSQSSPVLAARVRDLSNACITGFAATCKLKLVIEKQPKLGIPDRKRFWDDVNGFLKAIIAILAAAKQAMVDLPLLAEVRPEIGTLAKVAKEIPPLLEQSSYKLAMTDTSPRHAVHQMPSKIVTAGAVSPSIQPPTPLTASLGTAAQAIMSPGLQQQSPFFQDVKFDASN